MDELTQVLASINRGIPFAHDVSNVARGITSAATGGSFQEGFETQQQENQALTEDLRARRPNVAAFSEGTGNALPLALTAGGSLPAQATTATAARGLPLWANQSARGALAGSGSGFAYGAGTGDAQMEDWQNRLDRGNVGAGVGGALGAAAPTVVNAISGVSSPVVSALRRIPTPEPNAVGGMGGNLFAGRRGALQPAPGEHISRGTAARVGVLADRAGVTADDFAAFARGAREEPGGQVVLDAFGDAGIRQFRPIVSAPGQSGARAAEAVEQRFNDAPNIILNALRRRLGVGETPTTALARLDADYQRMSAELYRPIWERPLTHSQASALEGRTSTLMHAPIMQRAIRRADELFENDMALGLVRGAPDDHIGRWFHYVKMGLDDVIRSGRRDGSIAGNVARQANEARGQLLRAMDENIPNYREARRQWAGVAAAEDALEAGQGWLTAAPDDVQAAIAGMSEFERQHARIGLAEAIRRASRGQVIGNRNVANGALNDPDAQRSIAAAFDSPEQAAEFLDIVSNQNRLMRNASAWVGGSPTQGNLAYEADGALRVGVEAAGRGLTGDVVGAGRRLLGGAANALSAGAVERSNNQFGQVLLRRIDREEARAFASEVERILRDREAARAATDAAARSASISAGVAGQGGQQ